MGFLLLKMVIRMEWDIRLNNVHYTTRPTQEDKDVIDFLDEWYNDLEYVNGKTSGSTGVPKTIQLLKKDMLASASLTNRFFQIDKGSRLLLCLSPTYIAGKMMIVRAIAAGADLYTVQPSANPLLHINEHFDLAAMVPMQVDTILSHPVSTSRLKNISQVLVGGAPVSPSLEERLQQIGTACFATYGMTETVSHVALRALNGPRHADTYFALGQIHFSRDERECLVIHTPHLHEKHFITNDIVSIKDATHFQWLGRIDNVINSGGIKLFPEWIESQLSTLLSRRFFVTSLPDDRLGQKVILVIEGLPLPPEQENELMYHIRAQLPAYSVPKAIHYLEHFQETYSGKVIRKYNQPSL